MTGTLAAPPSREERARATVRALAWTAAVAAFAGTVMLAASVERSGQWLLGFTLVLGAFVSGVGCLWHGARHAHERGRAVAILAVVVAIPVLLLGTWGALTRNCGLALVRCVDLGFEEGG